LRAAAGVQGRLRVVLLEPKRGANVGAVCRAMKNMGAGELVIVGGQYDSEEARRTAVHAGDVFESIRTAATLDEAIGPATFVIGTTSRTQPWSIPAVPIDQAFAEARERGRGSIALVFGPEDHGLDNPQCARCHRLAFVPTADAYASLNLAQAAVVCLYEWLRSDQKEAGSKPRPGETAAADDRTQSAALADLENVLAEIGFLEGDQAERVMATIRSILTRSGLDEREVGILRGIARQIRWAARREPARKQAATDE